MSGTGGSIFNGGSGTLPANTTQRVDSPIVALTAGANYVFNSGLSNIADTTITNGSGQDISGGVAVSTVGGVVTVMTNVFIPLLKVSVTGTA